MFLTQKFRRVKVLFPKLLRLRPRNFGQSPLELLQKPQISVVKQTNIINSIFDHRDSIQTAPESESLPLARIYSDIFQNSRMRHSRAHHFNPAGFFAHRATFAAAFETSKVSFHARLHERKIARPETDF